MTDTTQEGKIEWWDDPDPSSNIRYFRHVGCDEGSSPWIVPRDDTPDPSRPTEECARCCIVLPLVHRVEASWMEIKIVVPEDDGLKILEFTRANLDFKQMDEDWCCEKREKDNATIDYAPSPSPPGNRKEGW